ncbi:MAG: hypothetical protein R3F24_06705 [Gammaproteobacteria bacterium]
MSCSTGGQLWLKNATDGPIELLWYQAESGQVQVFARLAAGEVQSVTVDNWASKQVIPVRINNEMQCLQVPAIARPWIKVGFFGPKVVAILSEDRMLYLYRPDEDKSAVFSHPPPAQPPGFPLVPQPC